MNREAAPKNAPDAALIAAVVDGDEAAWAALRDRARDPFYRAARRYFDDPLAAAEARNVLIELQADGCALLKRFKGGQLESFLGIVADTALGGRLPALFADDAHAAWTAFERRFKPDIVARIRRQFRIAPGQTLPSGRELDDLYADFADHLVGKRYKPLTAYAGSGAASFGWYLLNRVVANWCLDEHRREYARWRPPEGIKRLPELEQIVFQMMDRDHMSAAEVAAHLPDEPIERLEAAIETVFRTVAPGTRGRPRVESLTPAGDDESGGVAEPADPGESAETALVQAERATMAANAIARLDEEERRVLMLWLELEDMSEVAGRCGRTVAVARRIKERAVRKARKMIASGEIGTDAEAPELVRLFTARSG